MAKPDFSPFWTLEDRMRLILLLTHAIRDDIEKGCYGAMGRPNIQSVHEVMVSPAPLIESSRAEIEKLVDVFGRERLFQRIPAWESVEA